MEMQFVERVRRWNRETLTRLRHRSWRAWLAVVVLGYTILEVVRAFVSDAGTLILAWGFEGLEWVIRQPMGVGGLALLGYIAVLLGVTWWQSRPQPAPKADGPQPLREEERRLVQDIRTVWKRHGRLAITQLHGILSEATYNLGPEAFWSDLLRPIGDRLEHARSEFESSLDPKRAIGVKPIREQFNEMYGAYVQAMRWVAILQSKDELDIGGRSTERVQVWRQNHRDMVNRLQDLNADPEHQGTLKIFLNWVDNTAFRNFLTEAEMSREWLALIEESKARRQGADTLEVCE